MKPLSSDELQLQPDLRLAERTYETTVTEDDFQRDRQLLLDLCSKQKVDKLLMDFRNVHNTPTSMTFFQHGNRLAECFELRRMKYGVVVSDRVMVDAHFMETVAINRGVNMRCFKTRNEALEWLLTACNSTNS